MTANNNMGAAELLRKYLESPAGSDLLGEMVNMVAELLMDADVDVICSAGYNERSDDRQYSRNGHRARRWDTRAGTISLDIPKLSRRPRPVDVFGRGCGYGHDPRPSGTPLRRTACRRGGRRDRARMAP